VTDDITARDYITIAAGLMVAEGIPFLEAQNQARDMFREAYQEHVDFVNALTFLADLETPSTATH